MNKQFLISSLVMFVATMITGFVVHVVLLGQDYAALPNLYRSEADLQNYFVYMLLAHVLMGIGLTWVYRMGKEDKPWLQQGIRFAVAMAEGGIYRINLDTGEFIVLAFDGSASWWSGTP